MQVSVTRCRLPTSSS